MARAQGKRGMDGRKGKLWGGGASFLGLHVSPWQEILILCQVSRSHSLLPKWTVPLGEGTELSAAPCSPFFQDAVFLGELPAPGARREACRCLGVPGLCKSGIIVH